MDFSNSFIASIIPHASLSSLPLSKSLTNSFLFVISSLISISPSFSPPLAPSYTLKNPLFFSLKSPIALFTFPFFESFISN
jgi:hypothetical protein